MSTAVSKFATNCPSCRRGHDPHWICGIPIDEKTKDADNESACLCARAKTALFEIMMIKLLPTVSLLCTMSNVAFIAT